MHATSAHIFLRRPEKLACTRAANREARGQHSTHDRMTRDANKFRKMGRERARNEREGERTSERTRMVREWRTYIVTINDISLGACRSDSLTQWLTDWLTDSEMHGAKGNWVRQPAGLPRCMWACSRQASEVGTGRMEEGFKGRESRERGERGTMEDQEEVKDEEKAIEDEKVVAGCGMRKGGCWRRKEYKRVTPDK